MKQIKGEIKRKQLTAAFCSRIDTDGTDTSFRKTISGGIDKLHYLLIINEMQQLWTNLQCL